MIHTNPQGLVLLFQHLHERSKCVLDPISNRIKLVLAELLAIGIWFIENKQPRIDAHFVDVLGDFEGDARAVVMDIGHKWDHASLSSKR